MNTQTPMNAPQGDDEISLWDIVYFLKDGSRWLVGGLVFGLLGALGYVLVSPAQYEATAIVQPATVGMPTTTTTTTKGVEVESVAQTLERLKLPTFYDEAMLKACQAPSQQALSGGVKASQVKGNSLIQVSYRARSVAVAEACVNAVVATLARSQAEIAAPIIKTLEEQLSLSRQRLADEKAFQAQAEKRVSGSADGSLLMLKALSKREDIIQLQRQLVDQSVQLSVPITQPVRLLEPIYAPERPVAPKKLPVLAGGLFGGLVLGGLAFFVRRSWLARKAA